MQATIKLKESTRSIDLIRRKEMLSSHKVLVITEKDTIEAIDCRVYMSRTNDGASPVYAIIWIMGPNQTYGCGTGRATGGGYDKSSHAIGEAIESAGIELWKVWDNDNVPVRIHGAGGSTIREALRTITLALYPGARIALVETTS